MERRPFGVANTAVTQANVYEVCGSDGRALGT